MSAQNFYNNKEPSITELKDKMDNLKIELEMANLKAKMDTMEHPKYEEKEYWDQYPEYEVASAQNKLIGLSGI